MNEIFTYLIKVNILIMAFYALWYFAFRNETFYKINRIYLISAAFVSLILPFIQFSVNFKPDTYTFSYLLEEVNTNRNNISSLIVNIFSGKKIILIVYLTGLFFFTLRFLIRLFAVIRLIFINKSVISTKNKIVKLGSEFSAFSFLNFIFISENHTDKSEVDKIMKHEEIHIKQFHTIDNLFLEILTIVLWFNPFIYFLHKALKETHEYLADEGVIEQGYDSANYQLLLLEQSTGVQFGFATNFNKSLTLKRLAMMNKKSSKFSKLKLMLVLPLIAIMFFAFSCNDKNELKNSTENETLAPPPPPPVDNSTEKVYEEVDVMPEYPGGMEALSAYIIKNLVYPEQAKKDGITGKVYVQFVINKNGKVENVTIAKSENEIFNAEAIRIISSLPVWTPGLLDNQPVSVSFTIPLNFQLN